MSGIDRDAYRELFVQEATEHLDVLADGLTDLLAGNEVDEDALFRAAHSLKGMAATLGYDGEARVAHVLEDHLDRLRAGDHIPLPIMLEAVEALRTNVDAIGAGDPTRDLEGLIKRLEGAQAEGEGDPQTSGALSSGEQDGAGEQDDPGGFVPASVRVDASRLDRILDRTAALRIAQGRLERLLEETRREPAGYALTDAMAKLERQIHTLYSEALELRTLPASLLIRPLLRRVQQTAARHGKKVRTKVAGESLQLDRSLLEALGDPLQHLLTNAVVHGIEDPEYRKTIGKDPEGVITIKIARHAEAIRLMVEDDGQGIDLEAARAHAIEKGQLGKEEAERLGKDELIALVTRPGFTTTTRVSQEAGRGVGLDAVVVAVRRVGGQIQVETREGKGTRVELNLPPTLSLVEVIPVTVGGHTYAVPTDQVARVMQGPASEGAERLVALDALLGPRPENPYMVEEGEHAPIIQHARAIKTAAGQPSRQPSKKASQQQSQDSSPASSSARYRFLHHRKAPAASGHSTATQTLDGTLRGESVTPPALLVKHDGARIAVQVDHVEAPLQSIVKPLQVPTGAPAGTNGAIVLRDARVAVLLDLHQLLQRQTPPNQP
jgi:two-component system, chemotaxis family, sensor kinase CheA